MNENEKNKLEKQIESLIENIKDASQSRKIWGQPPSIFMNQQDRIVKDFLEQFSELNHHPSIEGDDYSDTPYFFFSVIRDILIDSIKSNPDLAKNISVWLDGVLNNTETNNYVEEMLWIEFFEGSEVNETYRTFLLSKLKNKANLLYRQYLYIMENGGLTDPKSGEILKCINGGSAKRTGKYISDIN